MITVSSESRVSIIIVNILFSDFIDLVILLMVSVHAENSAEQYFQILCE